MKQKCLQNYLIGVNSIGPIHYFALQHLLPVVVESDKNVHKLLAWGLIWLPKYNSPIYNCVTSIPVVVAAAAVVLLQQCVVVAVDEVLVGDDEFHWFELASN